MKDVFVSHVHEDAGLALELAEGLERQGYATWCYELDNPGSVRSGISSAIRESRALLVVVSPRSLAKRDEVGEEITLGREGKKHFVPLLYEVSEAGWRNDLPEGWRTAFADSQRLSLVSLAPPNLDEALQRLRRSLRSYGIEPGSPDYKRVFELRTARERWESERGSFWARLMARWDRLPLTSGLGILLTIGVAVATVVTIRGRHEPAGPTKVTTTIPAHIEKLVWITSPKLPQLPGSTVEQDFDALILSMTQALTRMKISYLGDASVEQELLGLGCPDLEKRNKTAECRDIRAVDSLKITAKVEPTFVVHGQTESLELRIGDGKSVRCVPLDPPAGSNLSSLGWWGARQIASCPVLGIEQSEIDGALAVFEKLNDQFERSFSDASSVAPPREGWVPSFVHAALAAAQPEAADTKDVQDALEQLRAALESRKVDKVLPLYISMPPEQQRSLKDYLASASDLRVEFIPPRPEITFSDGTASATFLRRDMFVDGDSHQQVQLAVRLTAVLTRADGGWKIQSLQKPS